jgi:hypothetical protein
MINGNRTKSERSRSLRDFYETPSELCDMALTLLYDDFDLRPNMILDPGCGNGRWGNSVRRTWKNDPLIHGIDLSVDLPSLTRYNIVTTGDYLTFEIVNRYDLIVGNPPYSLAEEFIDKSLGLVKDGGFVFFLLRLDFLASQRRLASLYNVYPKSGLNAVYVSSRRPSFYSTNGKHTVDTLEYAMFLWIKGYRLDPRLRWFTWEYND